MPRVRRYERSDSEAARRLFRELSRTHRDLYHLKGQRGRDPDRWYRTHMRKYGSKSLRVLEHDGKVVGLIGLLPRRESCEIEPFIVAPRSRGRGFGAELLRAVLVEAHIRRWRTLSVGVAARNSAALRAFHSLGFRTIASVELSTTVLRPAIFVPQKGPRIAGRRFSQ